MMQFLEWLVSLFKKKPQPKPPRPPEPTPTPTPKPPVGGIPRGFTLDSVDNLPKIIAAIKAMPFTPAVRIVFDYPSPPSEYRAAVEQISKVAIIIGQPSDSVYSGKMNTEQFKQRFQSYVNFFPEINIWEIGNEVNGDWAGKNVPAQTDEALKIVKAAGKLSMIVPYWNTSTCADRNGDYYEWIRKNISAYVKAETDYVAISIYGFDCDGNEPSYAVLDRELDRFVSLFPKAKVMVGEYGRQGSPQVMRHYLNYSKVGFGGYWHGYQDLLNPSGAMFKEFIK